MKKAKTKTPKTAWGEVLASRSTYHRLQFAEGILRLVASEHTLDLIVETGVSKEKIKQQLYRLADQLEEIRMVKTK